MSQQPPPSSPQKMQPQQQDYDDLQQLGLFHSSSLREPTDPPLPIISVQTYQLKKCYSGDNQEMYNQYVVVKELGRGAFGQVVEVVQKNTKVHYAMKMCSVLGLEKQRFFAADGEFASSMDMLQNQLNITKRLAHKNISKCLQIMHNSSQICLIHQLANLGQIMLWSQLDQSYTRNPKLLTYLTTKYKTNNLGDITRIIFIQVCEAVKYLHQHQITNRDIKVDNLLARETEAMGDQIVVVDFTTVRYKENDDISYFPTGTPGFRGPEHQFASQEGYSCKATDVWAVGIAMWTFYHQKLPFPGEDDLERDISAKNVPLTYAEDCPAPVVQAIEMMTRKQWKDRITIEQALDILKQQN